MSVALCANNRGVQHLTHVVVDGPVRHHTVAGTGCRCFVASQATVQARVVP